MFVTSLNSTIHGRLPWKLERSCFEILSKARVILKANKQLQWLRSWKAHGQISRPPQPQLSCYFDPEHKAIVVSLIIYCVWNMQS